MKSKNLLSHCLRVERVHISNNPNPSGFRSRTCSHFCEQPRPPNARDREALRSVGVG